MYILGVSLKHIYVELSQKQTIYNNISFFIILKLFHAGFQTANTVDG